MNYCYLPVLLSYITISYFIASIFYIMMTRNIGTPFKDSLTKQQRLIKQKSSKKRMNIFITGFFITLFLLFIIKPFQVC